MKAHLWEHMKRDWQGEGVTERGWEVSVGARWGKRKGTKKRGLKREASARFNVEEGTEKWDKGANYLFLN